MKRRAYNKKMDYRAFALGAGKDEGLTEDLLHAMVACIEVESGYNPHAIHLNITQTGMVDSIDFGIVQVNDFFHIGAGLEFPTPKYVLNHPQECIRWMAKMFKAGKANLWSSYASGEYQSHLPKVVNPPKK